MILFLVSCWNRKLVDPSRETAEARSATSPVSRPGGYLRRHVFSTRFEPEKVIAKASECCMTGCRARFIASVLVFQERGDKEYITRDEVSKNRVTFLSRSVFVAHTRTHNFISLCRSNKVLQTGSNWGRSTPTPKSASHQKPRPPLRVNLCISLQ